MNEDKETITMRFGLIIAILAAAVLLTAALPCAPTVVQGLNNYGTTNRTARIESATGNIVTHGMVSGESARMNAGFTAGYWRDTEDSTVENEFPVVTAGGTHPQSLSWFNDGDGVSGFSAPAFLSLLGSFTTLVVPGTITDGDEIETTLAEIVAGLNGGSATLDDVADNGAETDQVLWVGGLRTAGAIHGSEEMTLVGTYTGTLAPSVTGAGTRFMWMPETGSLRAGRVTDTQWDTVGNYSVAFGYNSNATNAYSVAVGSSCRSEATGSTAIGNSAWALGSQSVAISGGRAHLQNCIAIGGSANASGEAGRSSGSVAIGNANALGVDSTALGYGATARGYRSVTLGGGVNKIHTAGWANEAAETPGSVTNTAGAYCSIGGGYSNDIKPIDANDQHIVIAGGAANTAYRRGGVIGGGSSNDNSGQYGTIAGGHTNVIGGSAQYSTIPGGLANKCGAEYAFVTGMNASVSATADRSFVWYNGGGVGGPAGVVTRPDSVVFSNATEEIHFGINTLDGRVAGLDVSGELWVTRGIHSSAEVNASTEFRVTGENGYLIFDQLTGSGQGARDSRVLMSVWNASGSEIGAGRIVRWAGDATSGNARNVALADYGSNSAGVTVDAIANGAAGLIVIRGTADLVVTNATVGQPLIPTNTGAGYYDLLSIDEPIACAVGNAMQSSTGGTVRVDVNPHWVTKPREECPSLFIWDGADWQFGTNIARLQSSPSLDGWQDNEVLPGVSPNNRYRIEERLPEVSTISDLVLHYSTYDPQTRERRVIEAITVLRDGALALAARDVTLTRADGSLLAAEIGKDGLVMQRGDAFEFTLPEPKEPGVLLSVATRGHYVPMSQIRRAEDRPTISQVAIASSTEALTSVRVAVGDEYGREVTLTIREVGSETALHTTAAMATPLDYTFADLTPGTRYDVVVTPTVGITDRLVPLAPESSVIQARTAGADRRARPVSGDESVDIGAIEAPGEIRVRP